MRGLEKGAYWVYQISTAALILYSPFLWLSRESPVLFLIGLLCYLGGLVLCAVSIFSFSSPAASGLNTGGMYRYSRNPMYVAYFFCFLGIAFLSRSAVFFGLLALFQISCHWIILAEERWCIATFGGTYLNYMRTVRRYLLRIFFWACLSEIPFDLMYGDSFFYPYHQNVLWTFLLSLLLIVLIEKYRSRFRPLAAVPLSLMLVALGAVIGHLTMVDYYGVGVLMVLVFYFFRGQDWKNRFIQMLCMYFLNVELLGGYYYEVQLFGHEIEFVQQGFAMVSLIPIWLYRGRQGYHSKLFQRFCYAFYPVHMIVLLFLRGQMLK